VKWEDSKGNVAGSKSFESGCSRREMIVSAVAGRTGERLLEVVAIGGRRSNASSTAKGSEKADAD